MIDEGIVAVDSSVGDGCSIVVVVLVVVIVEVVAVVVPELTEFIF